MRRETETGEEDGDGERDGDEGRRKKLKEDGFREM
jgi:hypothetical protein